MPCRCEDDYERGQASEHASNRGEIERLQKSNDRLTALLCKACNKLDANNLFTVKKDELLVWWTSHCKADRKRIAKDIAEARKKIKEDEKALKEAQANLKLLEEEGKEINRRKR